VSWKEHTHVERRDALDRVHVGGEIAVGRIDHHRAEPAHQVPGDHDAAIGLVEDDVVPRVAGCEEGLDMPVLARLSLERDHLAILERAVGAEGLDQQRMREQRHTQAPAHLARGVIAMMVGRDEADAPALEPSQELETVEPADRRFQDRRAGNRSPHDQAIGVVAGGMVVEEGVPSPPPASPRFADVAALRLGR
jgi:hypothetical protein